jgi:hypothetical protein
MPQLQYFKMLSIIEGRAKIIDMRKKSCLYVGLWKFKELELLHLGQVRKPFGRNPNY